MRQSQHESGVDPLVGRLIAGKFQIRRCVGVGASGSVYQSDQVALGRTVAVKILRPELTGDERLVKRFHDEALAASRLNHPNTVSVIDYGQTDDGLLFIVMEFLRGRTLTEVMEEDGPLPTERVADIMVQVLSGLEEAHAAGVVHADLKADNIVVEHRRGDWDLAKVVDFGIARLINAPREVEITEEKTVCGTPEYMAPELIAGHEPTVATDMYAAGVLLYELIVGQTPFAGGSSLEVLTRHLKEPVMPPSERCLDRPISPALESAAMRALAKKPEQRFASVAEFREAVSAAVAGSARHEAQVMCPGCGVVGAASFKFCPECGHPRGVARRTTRDFAPRMTAAAMARAATEMSESLSRETLTDAPAPRGADTLLDGEIVEGHGLFPLPLVGRESEFAALREFVTAESTAPTLLLVGSPGSGRSRLVREVCASVAELGVRVYLAGSDPTGLRSPYYPVRAIVAAILQLPPVCPYDGIGDALEAIGLTRRDQPGLGELFGHETDLRQLEPPVRRRELLASTIRVLRAACDQQPTAIVFEDAERYDAPSQELLRRLSEASDAAELRVVVTCDPALAQLWPAACERITLAPLAEAPLARVAKHLERVDNAEMPDTDALARNTDRSPSAVSHLVRYIAEGGSIAAAPQAVADLVAARLELLPRQAHWILQAIAAFGCEASRDQLAMMLAAVPGDAVDDALVLLDARALLVLDGEIAWLDQELVRNVVYESTPADVRRELHAAALRALEPMLIEPAVLGHHSERAGQLSRAAHLLARAGDDAIHQLDDNGACVRYNRAMSCARELMLGDDEDSRDLFVATSVKLAETLRVTGQVALARGVVEEARDHAQGIPDLEAQLLRASAHLFQTEGDGDAAAGLLRDAIGLALTTGDTELLSELYLDLSSMHMRAGAQDRAAGEIEEAINLVTLGEGEQAADGPRAMWHLLLRLSQLRQAADQLIAARVAGEAALRHAERVFSRVGIARVQSLLAQVCEQAGELAEADRYRRAAVEQMRRLGDRRATAELLLSGASPTRSMMRILPAHLREARALAAEIGWSEGVAEAQQRLR